MQGKHSNITANCTQIVNKGINGCKHCQLLYMFFSSSSSSSSDKSLRRCVEGQGAALLQVSSPSTPSVLTEEGSNPRSPGQAVESLFRDSNIQDIVNRYTRELNFSLRATARSTGASPTAINYYPLSLSYHYYKINIIFGFSYL